MALGGMDLNLLLVLQALLEECNVSRAAIRVGVPQPAVSNALARLRRHYRDELLVRSGNGYMLTPLARSLLPSVRESVRLIGDALSPENGPGQPERTFTITLSDWSLMLIGESLLRRVHELAPGVNLRVRRITQDTREDDNWVHQHDLLIAPAGFYSPAGESMVLCRDRFVCVLDPGNPRLRDGQLSLADFAALPHATAQLPHAIADPVRSALDRLGVRPTITVATSGWLLLPFLVAGTDMVAVIPERLARRIGGGAGVATVEPPFGAVEVIEAAWWHPLRATDPSHAWLRAVLTETALLNDASQLAIPCSHSGSLFTYVN
jgi:DNA-binding transcriptional LysR family regulator